MAQWGKLRKAIKGQYRFGMYAWRNLDQEQPNVGEIVLIKWKNEDIDFWMENVAVHTSELGGRVLGFTDIYTQTPLMITEHTVWTPFPELPKSNRRATDPGNWISVRERAPKPKDTVLVLTLNKLVALGFIYQKEPANQSPVFHELYSDLPLRATHWVALPDLPTGS